MFLVILMTTQCIFCKKSEDIVKAGFRYNMSGQKQRYRCNKCKSFFVPNDGFWKMKNRPEVIAEAISLKKRGMPYQQVSKHFKEYGRAKICPATTYNWVRKYGKALRNFSMKQSPNLSGKINIDEFLSKIKKNEDV
jgi:transposase-like protein